jgi:hypothetical protein
MQTERSIDALGGTDKARATFIEFQRQPYRKEAEQVALLLDVGLTDVGGL